MERRVEERRRRKEREKQTKGEKAGGTSRLSHLPLREGATPRARAHGLALYQTLLTVITGNIGLLR